MNKIEAPKLKNRFNKTKVGLVGTAAITIGGLLSGCYPNKIYYYGDEKPVSGQTGQPAVTPSANETPKPSTPTTTPDLEIKPRPAVTELPARPGTDVTIPENIPTAVGPGTVISGDIKIFNPATNTYINLYDENVPGTEKTGLIVKFQGTAPTTIIAPFGASGREDLKSLAQMNEEIVRIQAPETFRARPEIKVIEIDSVDNGHVILREIIGDTSFLTARAENPLTTVSTTPTTPQPTAINPAPVEIRQAPADLGVAFALRVGQEATVSRAVFSGDVLVNNVRKYDSDSSTGLIIIVRDSALITASENPGSGRANFTTDAGINAEAQREINAAFAADFGKNRILKITVQNNQISEEWISRP